MIIDEPLVAEYYAISEQLESTRDEIASYIHNPENCIQFIKPGRLVRLREGRKVSIMHTRMHT